MRLQLASLISAAGVIGLAANATAQEATSPPPPATAPVPAPTAPAGPMTAPATTPPPAMPAPAPAPAQPDATAGQPAPAPAPADSTEPPAPPPPVLPTSGDGYTIVQILDKVCEPGVKGGNLDALAKSYGFKKSRTGPWTMAFGAKPYTITIDPFSIANPNVCNVTFDYTTGGAQAIIDGLNAWTYLHEPTMQLYRNDEYKNATFIGRTISWEHVGDNGASTGLVFVGKKKPDGTAFSKYGDQATLLFQIRNGG